MTDLRLVIFDVDGTLVDSQDMIWAAMCFAYDKIGCPVPDRGQTLGYVGMSLDLIFPQLSPELSARDHIALADGYRESYKHLRETKGSAATSPFFPGGRDVLDQLRAQDWTLMAVATGKSKRGLDKLIEGYGLAGYFQSEQTADHHPSKPHPAMIHAVLSETGVAPERAVMIGDTTFDMDMAEAAGVASIGVSWGYHPAENLRCDRLITSFAALLPAIDDLLGPQI